MNEECKEWLELTGDEDYYEEWLDQVEEDEYANFCAFLDELTGEKEL